MDDTPDTYAENSPNGGVPFNIGTFASAFYQDNSPLQGAPEPALAEPGAPETNGNKVDIDLLSPPSGDKRHSQEGGPPSEKNAAREQAGANARREPAEALKPPKPDDATLLAEVRKILDPDSGKWWGAKFVAHRHMAYTAQKVARLLTDELDPQRPEIVDSAEPKEVEAAIRYVMWEAEEEVS